MKHSIPGNFSRVGLVLAAACAALAFSISTPSEEVECDMGKVCSFYVDMEEKLGQCGKRTAVGYDVCICTYGSVSQDQEACKKSLYE